MEINCRMLPRSQVRCGRSAVGFGNMDLQGASVRIGGSELKGMGLGRKFWLFIITLHNTSTYISNTKT